MRLIILISMLLINCAGYKATQSEPEPDPATVQIFFSPPQVRYNVIGTIAEDDENYQDMIEDLQEKTIERGGNAFIVIQQGNGTQQQGTVIGTPQMVVGSSGEEGNHYMLVQVIKLQP